MSESTAGDWVLDPSASTVEFAGKSFWGAMPVRGKFSKFSGRGTVGADGAISGLLVIDAATLDTKNSKRDEHLRSADFFKVEQHPDVTVTVTSATLNGSSLSCTGTIEAAGVTVPVTFTANIDSSSADAVVLHAELPIPRSKFGMTWNQLPGMVRDASIGKVTAKFVRP